MTTSAATRYVPPNAIRIRSKLSESVVYLYTAQSGKLAAMGYVGRAVKAAFCYSFGSPKFRAEYVAKWMRDQDAKATAKRERQAAPRALEVGDVLVATWGYEQTNVDFYEVVRLIGAKSVGLRPIQRESHQDGDMTGHAVPLPGEFAGEEFTARPAPDGSVRLNSYSCARKAERVIGANGEQLGYRPHRWTAYA